MELVVVVVAPKHEAGIKNNEWTRLDLKCQTLLHFFNKYLCSV